MKVKIGYTIFLLCLTSTLLSQALFSNWQVISEGRDESRYRIVLDGSVVEALEISWYAVSASGSIHNDCVLFICNDAFGKPAAVFRYGRDGDNVDNISGWHLVYLILPSKTAVKTLDIVLRKNYSNPKLVTKLSTVKPANLYIDLQWFPLTHQGKVSYTGYESLPRGKVWMHAAGFFGAPSDSRIDYVIWKRFTKPTVPQNFSPNPDVYFDTIYAGTINVVGEGWTGQGGYTAAIQAGIGQGDWINNAIASGKAQLLWKATSHASEGFIREMMVNTASGVIDIAIDVLDLTLLGYIKFAIESALLFNTLRDIDEKVFGKTTVVFENFPLNPNQSSINVWLRLRAQVVALGFAHSVLSFHTDGTVEGDLKGNRGMEIGTILLHYKGPQSPEILESSLKDGSTEVSLQQQITLKLSTIVNSFDSSKIFFKKAGTGQIVQSNVRLEGDTVKISPKTNFEPNTAYDLTVQSGAFRSNQAGNLREFNLKFTTGSAPTIVGCTLNNGAVEVPLKPSIKFLLNKDAIIAYSSFIVVKKLNGEYVTDAGRSANVSIVGKELIVNFVEALSPEQTYVLEVQRGVLKDSSGNMNTPYSIIFTTVPYVRVVSTQPSNKHPDAPADKPITIQFNKNIKPGSKYDSIQLKNAKTNAIVAIDKLISGSSLVLKPKQPLQQLVEYVVVIPDGAVANAENDAPNTAHNFSFKCGAPPQLVKVEPTNGSKEVFRDQIILLTFSEAIRAGADFSRLSVRTGNTQINYSIKLEYNCIFLTPTSILPANTLVTVFIPKNAFVDLGGSSLDKDYTVSFTTGSGAYPPRIVSSSPSDGDQSVSINSNIYVRFDKTILEGPNWGNIVLKTISGETVQIQKLISYGVQLEVRPVQKLKPNTTYTLILPAGCVKEQLGSLLQGEVSIKFTTEARSGTM